MTIAIPRQMTEHTLEVTKGWFEPAAVDYQAKVDMTVLNAISGGIVFGGRCVHLASDGEFELGCSGTQMPMWLRENSCDPDVSNYGGDPQTRAGAWVAGGPRRYNNALPAKGAYEMRTTEFDATLNYAYNDLLYAATGTTLATAGVMTNAGIGSAFWPAVAACGVVSVGRVPTSAKNIHGIAELSFWPVYMPGMNGRTEPTWA